MTTTHIHPFQHLDAIVRANHASLSVEYVPGHTKTSTFEKLEQANAVVDNLEHDIYPNDTEEDASILPKCIYMSEFRNKPHLVFDMRKDGSDKRLSLKMVLPTEYNLQDELERFREKIIAKYGDGII